MPSGFFVTAHPTVVDNAMNPGSRVCENQLTSDCVFTHVCEVKQKTKQPAVVWTVTSALKASHTELINKGQKLCLSLDPFS